MTLVEVAIASTVLAVVALGVAPLLAIAARANADSRLEVDAAAAGTQRMEQLRAAPFDAALSPPDSLTVDYPDFSDIVISAAGVLTRRWSIAAASFDPDDTRVLTVSVAANGRPPLVLWATIRTRTGDE